MSLKGTGESSIKYKLNLHIYIYIYIKIKIKASVCLSLSFYDRNYYNNVHAHIKVLHICTIAKGYYDNYMHLNI